MIGLDKSIDDKQMQQNQIERPRIETIADIYDESATGQILGGIVARVGTYDTIALHFARSQYIETHLSSLRIKSFLVMYEDQVIYCVKLYRSIDNLPVDDWKRNELQKQFIQLILLWKIALLSESKGQAGRHNLKSKKLDYTELLEEQ